MAASTTLAIFSVTNLVSFLHSYDSSVTGCLGWFKNHNEPFHQTSGISEIKQPLLLMSTGFC